MKKRKAEKGLMAMKNFIEIMKNEGCNILDGTAKREKRSE
jgi:hypothetical protein